VGANGVGVKKEPEFRLEEIQLLKQDEEEAIRLLQERGLIAGDFDPAKHTLQPVPTTRVAQRQALRSGVNMRVITEAARILSERKVKLDGHELDRKHLGRNNLGACRLVDHSVNN
jgi:hypothetical protein